MTDTPEPEHPDALTEIEKDSFEALVRTMADLSEDDGSRVALMRAKIDRDALPENVAVLLSSFEYEEETVNFPLAIMVTPEVFDGLIPPEGATVVREGEEEHEEDTDAS